MCWSVSENGVSRDQGLQVDRDQGKQVVVVPLPSLLVVECILPG